MLAVSFMVGSNGQLAYKLSFRDRIPEAGGVALGLTAPNRKTCEAEPAEAGKFIVTDGTAWKPKKCTFPRLVDPDRLRLLN